MSQEEVRIPGIYFSVINGSFRTKVDENDPRAVKRTYEGRDGTEGTKYERIVDALTGYIEDIGIHEGDYGKVIVIKLDKNEDGKHPIVQLSAGTAYGEDFLKKLPNIDLDKPVRLSPYAFTNEANGREVRGIAITQRVGDEDVKVLNFFYDGEQKTPINGYPIPDGDTQNYGTEDWKIYFLQARKFLIAYATEHVIPKLGQRTTRPVEASEPPSKAPEYPEEEINPEDIPF